MTNSSDTGPAVTTVKEAVRIDLANNRLSSSQPPSPLRKRTGPIWLTEADEVLLHTVRSKAIKNDRVYFRGRCVGLCGPRGGEWVSVEEMRPVERSKRGTPLFSLVDMNRHISLMMENTV